MQSGYSKQASHNKIIRECNPIQSALALGGVELSPSYITYCGTLTRHNDFIERSLCSVLQVVLQKLWRSSKSIIFRFWVYVNELEITVLRIIAESLHSLTQLV